MIDTLVYWVHHDSIHNFAATFTEVAQAGIPRVVLSPRMGDIDLLYPEHVTKARGILARLHLDSPGGHGSHSGHNDLNEADQELRPRMISMHTQLMNGMAELGCQTYVCHPGTAHHLDSRPASWELVRRALDELAPKAQSFGLTIALENLPSGYLGDNAEELLRFVDDYASPHVRICYDSGHAHMAADAVSVLKTLTPLVVTAHLHDNDGTEDQHLIPGHGTIDWKALQPFLTRCPGPLHVEAEAFNTEKWNHIDVYRRYCEILTEPSAAPDA